METSVYIPDNTKILHTTYADFVTRQIGRTVHIVQYDDGLPILEVKLFADGQPYRIPENAVVNIKLGKSDGKFVYNPALGCNSERCVVYFEITYQMAVLAGNVNPLIEVVINDTVAASSPVCIVIDRNPIQREDIESTSEWKMIYESVEYAKEAISAAARAVAARLAAETSATNASKSENNARVSETNAGESALEAETSATNAETSAMNADISAKNAKKSEENAKDSENVCADYAKAAESYAIGDTDYRENESVDNARYYYQQARRISEGLGGVLIPMGTISFSELSIQEKTSGHTFNISDRFTSDETFKDGGGLTYPPGTNVYYTADGYWDCLAGSSVAGVKGEKDSDYEQGYVNITAERVGAYTRGSIDLMFANCKEEADAHYTNDKVHITSLERKKWNKALAGDGDAKDTIVTFESGDSKNPTGYTDVGLIESGEKQSSLWRKVSLFAKNVRYLWKLCGMNDISGLADGTLTGAVSKLNTDLSGKARIQTGSSSKSFADAANSTGTTNIFAVLDYKVHHEIDKLGSGLHFLTNGGPVYGLLLQKTAVSNYNGIVFSYAINNAIICFGYLNGKFSYNYFL